MGVCANIAEDIYLYSKMAVLVPFNRERNNLELVFISDWLPARSLLHGLRGSLVSFDNTALV